MTDDGQLLAAYVRDGSERAFGEIVERYARLVYGIGFRKTGSVTLSEEITQNTFAVLARKAEHLKKRKTLGGWLVNTARFEAARVLRTECRRLRKMKAYSTEPTMDDSEPTSPTWEAALPHLDDALSTLAPHDREAVVLRFYRKRSYREIGSLIGASEEGSRRSLCRKAAIHRHVPATRFMETRSMSLKKSGKTLRQALIGS